MLVCCVIYSNQVLYKESVPDLIEADMA